MTTLTPTPDIQFRCVGWTDGGAPTSGSFVPGNWVLGQHDIFVCVAPGTPGTWTPMGAQDAGVYAAIPGSPVTFTQTYSTTATTVPAATYAAPAVTAATVATASAADQSGSYVEADVDSIATLANALKAETNKVITDNTAQNTALAALAADVLVLKKLINSLIDGQQAAGIAS